MKRLHGGDAHGAEQGFRPLLDVEPDQAAAWQALGLALQRRLAGSPDALRAQRADRQARGWSINDLQPLAHVPHRPTNSDACSAAARLADPVARRLVGWLA